MLIFEHKDEVFLKAKIYKSSKRVFECRILESGQVVSATALREIVKNSHPVVGDYVILNKAPNDEFEIIELVERENSIFRKIVRTQQTKHIAANIDVMLIVASVSKPDYKPFLIDRYLLRATQWEIPVVVVFNKMDQFDDQFDIEFERTKLEHLGVKVIETSSTEIADKKFKNSLDELHDILQDKTAICLGQSGVGKSKLISALSQGEIELLSSELAKGVGKGAHTTTWAEVVDLGDFEIIDSPGVRSMSLQDISLEELDELFPDLIPFFGQCQFTDCKHELNSKGCSFLALDEEKLEDLIILERLNSYLKIRDEVESIPEWTK